MREASGEQILNLFLSLSESNSKITLKVTCHAYLGPNRARFSKSFDKTTLTSL